MKISALVAADEANGIGKDNKLLCHLPADLKYFKQVTMGHHILMGRKTYDSIGRPLPGRVNLVITHSNALIEGAHVFNSIEAGVGYAKKNAETELVIIGGDSIFEQSLHLVDIVYLTRIHHTFEADVFFPELATAQWKLISKTGHEADDKNPFAYTFEVYERIVA